MGRDDAEVQRGRNILTLSVHTGGAWGRAQGPRKGAWCQNDRPKPSRWGAGCFCQFPASVLCGSEPGLVSEFIRSPERGNFTPPTLPRMSYLLESP